MSDRPIPSRPALLGPWLRRLDMRKDQALHEAMRLLPTPLVSALGAGLARLGAETRHRGKIERSMRALAYLRPELDEAERRALALENICNIGRSLAEFSCLHRLWGEGRIETVGQHNITAPNAVLALLHLGNWEAKMVAIRGLGLRAHSIYQPPSSPAQTAIAMRVRHALGNDAILASTMAPRQALRLLARGDTMLGVFMDEFKQGRVNGPAFGRLPATGGNMQLALRLAVKAGVPLVPAYMLRLPGSRFRAHFLPALPLTGNLPEDQAALEAVIEPLVRRHLDQWLMLYAFRPDR